MPKRARRCGLRNVRWARGDRAVLLMREILPLHVRHCCSELRGRVVDWPARDLGEGPRRVHVNHCGIMRYAACLAAIPRLNEVAGRARSSERAGSARKDDEFYVKMAFWWISFLDSQKRARRVNGRNLMRLSGLPMVGLCRGGRQNRRRVWLEPGVPNHRRTMADQTKEWNDVSAFA